MRFTRAIALIGVTFLVSAVGILTPAAASENRPPPPAALVGVEMSESVYAISWAPTVETSAAAEMVYRVYRSEDGATFEVITETDLNFFADGAFNQYNTKAYAVTSVSPDGVESHMSLLILRGESNECVRQHRTSVQIYLRSCLNGGN